MSRLGGGRREGEEDELDREAVGDGALVRRVVVASELLVLGAHDFISQLINS